MPHIDSSYRTIPRRGHRIIGGFSMGGYGACPCAVKYPELFSTCFSMDGAMHTLGTMKRIRGPIFSEIFEDDDDYFRDYCLAESSRLAGREHGCGGRLGLCSWLSSIPNNSL
jgi:S-formylglutathione hydrolase FrmB